jgi:3-isopropylmalate dehydrogenase
MFGDILSDEAAMITGTIGTAASAALGAAPVLGERAFGLYEPISGTAPDIAGRGIANPTGAILSAAMLARFSLARPDAADRIERAVAAALASGPRTADLEQRNPASTAAFTDLILGMLDAPVALR